MICFGNKFAKIADFITTLETSPLVGIHEGGAKKLKLISTANYQLRFRKPTKAKLAMPNKAKLAGSGMVINAGANAFALEPL
ncbi:hypothetical protein Pr1d_30820 [Bythopirellula goksoeyrii]|uniref:Uncharacterized protein n=1 Tax=Bythopirellula goksoeyrii TaxID=1400387 RepID=A0A5B9QFT6_9BACT|nr:hypothetical protein Pr1d_30820 [Bythopirellula goksoeyrii]